MNPNTDAVIAGPRTTHKKSEDNTKEESKGEPIGRIASPVATLEERDLHQKYVAWMEESGAKLDKIALKYFAPDYRGIVAKQHIHKGDVVIFVPKSAMITLKTAKQGKIGAQVVAKNVTLTYPNNSFLSSYVLAEQTNPASPWKLLFDAFPKNVSNFPIFFSESEKNLLTGSPFLTTINDLIRDMEKDYKAICAAAPEFSKMATLYDFMKTRSLVNSRIFGTKVDGEDNDSIVPFADMFNYKYQSNMTHWTYDESAEGFVVRAKENIMPGKEVYVYYGNKPNSSFLLFYGFIVEDNENDDVTLTPCVSSTDPLKQVKEKWLGPSCLTQRMRVCRITDDSKFQKFMSYLRFVVFKGLPEELESLLGTTHDVRKLMLPPFSIENEKDVLNLFKDLAQEQLSKYPETVEEDMEILKRVNLTYNERNCIMFRASEKQTLAYFIDLAEKGLEILNGKLWDWDDPRSDRYFIGLQHLINNKMEA